MSFGFAVNSSGVMYDEMIYNDGDYDSDWNAIWQAEVQINEFGWSIEMEIPFSNLQFYDSKNIKWGMNFTRFIERKYETINRILIYDIIEINGFVFLFPNK